MNARRMHLGLLWVLTSMTVWTGCSQLGAIAYYLRPRQIQKPQYEFPAGTRVAFVIEAVNPQQENPVFNQALYERVTDRLREGKSGANLLPLSLANDLRRRNLDYPQWSLQRIGREMNADQVLYIKIDSLTIRPTPDHPLLTPEVALHVKLISVQEPPLHARIWPDAKEGHLVQCKRQVAEAADENPEGPDVEARKLAYDTAYWVTMPFLEIDLEENPPVER